MNHPLQPDVQHLHVLLAPLLVFTTGLLWSHASAGLRGNGRKGSGIMLIAAFAPMVASGYLLQVAVEPHWREVWLWTHLVASGLWTAGVLAHVALALRRRAGAVARALVAAVR